MLGKERHAKLLEHPPVLKRLGAEPDQPGVTPLALLQLLVPGCQHLERFLIFQVLPVQSTDPVFRRFGIARILSQPVTPGVAECLTRQQCPHVLPAIVLTRSIVTAQLGACGAAHTPRLECHRHLLAYRHCLGVPLTAERIEPALVGGIGARQFAPREGLMRHRRDDILHQRSSVDLYRRKGQHQLVTRQQRLSQRLHHLTGLPRGQGDQTLLVRERRLTRIVEQPNGNTLGLCHQRGMRHHLEARCF